MQRTVLVRNLLKKTPEKLVYKPPSDEIQASWMERENERHVDLSWVSHTKIPS